MKKKFYLLFTFLMTFMVSLSSVSAKVYNNYNSGNKIKCGKVEFASSIADVFYYVLLIVQIAVPITLVLFGMMDLVKAMVSGKDDDIKKSQGVLFKRIVTGALVFLIIFVVKFSMQFVSADQSVVNCIKCFTNGSKACR